MICEALIWFAIAYLIGMILWHVVDSRRHER